MNNHPNNTNQQTNYQMNVDGLVFDFFKASIEAILLERKSTLIPVSSSPPQTLSSSPSLSTGTNTDYVEYINNSLQQWKKSLSRPITLDIYLFNSKQQSHILIERWNFFYQALNDVNPPPSSSTNKKESVTRLYSMISRRIQALTRSLYCFIRLLPGFNLLASSQVPPVMNFQIYDARLTPSSFVHEPSKYQFPTVNTSKGRILSTVSFVTSTYIKAMLQSGFTGSVMSSSSTAAPSAAVLIPNRTPGRY
jgi:hypothetical protein